MKNTLIINRFSSICGECKEAANPAEKVHSTVMGYTPEVGCGCKFLYVTSEYLDLLETFKKNPDHSMIAHLEIIDYL